MIDRIRSEIQERLDQLLAEADKLRHALTALDPVAARAPRTTSADGAARGRTAPGATKRAVLDALNREKALTAGEVAAATGLARPTVSTTLSKLASSGEIDKAQRGYQLAGNRRNAAAKAAAVK